MGLDLTLMFVLLSYIFYLNLAFLSLTIIGFRSNYYQRNLYCKIISSINWHLFLTIMAQCDKIIRHLQYEVEIYRVLKKHPFRISNFCLIIFVLIFPELFQTIGLHLSFQVITEKLPSFDPYFQFFSYYLLHQSVYSLLTSTNNPKFKILKLIENKN